MNDEATLAAMCGAIFLLIWWDGANVPQWFLLFYGVLMCVYAVLKVVEHKTADRLRALTKPKGEK